MGETSEAAKCAEIMAAFLGNYADVDDHDHRPVRLGWLRAMYAALRSSPREARRAAFAEALARWRDGSIDSMEYDEWLEAQAEAPDAPS